MATVTITDDGSTVKLIIDSVTYSVPKPFIIAVSGTVLTIKQDESRWSFEFADVTSPVTASANALRILLEGYIESGGEKTILQGITDNGAAKDISATGEGHIEAAIHDPLTVFGAVHVEQETPVYQNDAVYGINTNTVVTSNSGSGTVTAADSAFLLQTGTTVASQGVFSSKKRLRYRAGQGVKVMFTAMYTTPVINSYQGAGCGTSNDGVYFGYGNTSDLTDTRFGILYVSRGIREVKTLTITTGATSASNVTITLNGTPFVIAVTAASNIQRTVWEISQGVYAGWDAFPQGATVIFVRQSAGTTAGSQTFAAGTTGTVATIAQTKAGAASTDVFYPQASWNGDKLDGTGASGVTLNPQALNIFRINIGYLGAHDLSFQVKVTPSTGNNSTWVTVNTIKLSNITTITSFSNPTFPFNAFVYSAGSTTNLTLKIGSYAGFLEGKKLLNGARASYNNVSTVVGTAAYYCLFTILNPRYILGKANQSVINLISLTGALKHTSPCLYYIIRNGALLGNPNFQLYSTTGVGLWDTTATTVTTSDNSQQLFVDHLGDTGDLDHKFGNGDYNAEEFTLQPGEWVTLAAKSIFGTPAYVTGGLNTREDQ